MVASLQKYAASKLGLHPGDYSYVAEMIENEFIQSAFRILFEFGIPISAIQKIQNIYELKQISVVDMSDEDFLKSINLNIDLIGQYFTKYEMEILSQTI